jgi:hypothetical protein
MWLITSFCACSVRSGLRFLMLHGHPDARIDKTHGSLVSRRKQMEKAGAACGQRKSVIITTSWLDALTMK